MQLPDTFETFLVFLQRHAAHGQRALEEWIKQFNLRTREWQRVETQRRERRAHFIQQERTARWTAYVEETMKRFEQEAAADFDSENPAIEVPPVIPLRMAKDLVTARKGK